MIEAIPRAHSRYTIRFDFISVSPMKDIYMKLKNCLDIYRASHRAKLKIIEKHLEAVAS